MATPYDTQLTDNIVQYVAQSQDDVLTSATQVTAVH